MSIRAAAAASLALLLCAAAQPVVAQTSYARNVAFFERAFIGGNDITPIALNTDTRCADIRFCSRDDDLVITAVLREPTYDGVRKRELIMRIDTPIAVPGGFLVLRAAGTRPALNGAIPLEEYKLALEFLPLRRR